MLFLFCICSRALLNLRRKRRDFLRAADRIAQSQRYEVNRCCRKTNGIYRNHCQHHRWRPVRLAQVKNTPARSNSISSLISRCVIFFTDLILYTNAHHNNFLLDIEII